MNTKGSKATKWVVKFRKLLIVLVIVAVSVTGIVMWQQKKKKANEAPLNIAAVERRDIILTVTATGTLEPLTTVDVKSNVAGEITELAVDRGDYDAQKKPYSV